MGEGWGMNLKIVRSEQRIDKFVKRDALNTN